jgi:putative FmdB family regulatory protein
MPVYTYRCHNCGNEFDHTQKFTDPFLTKCPVCGQETLRKVFTPVGIVFKGKGFYATDHKSPSGGKRSLGHSDERGGEGSSESKSSESSSSESTTKTTTAESSSKSESTKSESSHSESSKSGSGESR